MLWHDPALLGELALEERQGQPLVDVVGDIAVPGRRRLALSLRLVVVGFLFLSERLVTFPCPLPLAIWAMNLSNFSRAWMEVPDEVAGGASIGSAAEEEADAEENVVNVAAECRLELMIDNGAVKCWFLNSWHSRTSECKLSFLDILHGLDPHFQLKLDEERPRWRPRGLVPDFYFVRVHIRPEEVLEVF